MANAKELREAVKLAEARVDGIKQGYKELKLYLVFSCSQGQVPVDASPKQILKELPQMVVDNAIKTAALKLLATLEQLKDRRDLGKTGLMSEIHQVEKRLAETGEKLTYTEDVYIEIRMGRLEYESIWKLKMENVVDRQLTSPSRASIRVVLTTLAKLCKEHRNAST